MTSVAQARMTSGQYLAQEREAEFRSKFYLEETFAMASASRCHNLIAGNILATIHGEMGTRDCEVFQGDMRLFNGKAYSASTSVNSGANTHRRRCLRKHDSQPFGKAMRWLVTQQLGSFVDCGS